MNGPSYDVSAPVELGSAVVFASPHSGRDYSRAFLSQTVLDSRTVRSSEDAFVDKLFDFVPEFGASFIRALTPRACVDLNRAPEELDPALIESLRPQGHNPRVASGLGVIPRVVANGRAIYRGKITMAEAQRRLDQSWRPYHAQLAELLDRAHVHFGCAVLVDCHSMPHEAMDGIARGGMRRPDIVLGDRFGAAAAPEIMDRIEAAFAGAGFAVTRNAPFAGAYITQTYGRPSRGMHAVQVEIDRSLYMDEAKIQPNRHFDAVRARLRDVVEKISTIGQDRLPLAAE